MRGRYEESLPYFEETLRVRPGDPSAHFNYAVVLEILGRTEESHREYSETARLAPQDPEARAGMERTAPGAAGEEPR